MSPGGPAQEAREPCAAGNRTGRALEPGPPWLGRRVVLGVCGGIAAYKSIQIARDLTLHGATVDVVLTNAARRFVAPLAFEGVTGRGPLIDLFAVGGAALHVGLGRDADCVCVAPATADFLARAASGRASDLLGTVLTACEAPAVFAPAMNDRMFAHRRTRANLALLDAAPGYQRVGPDTGRLAAGEGSGPGRMADPSAIVDAVGRALHPRGALSGATVLVTSGPTREPLDAVRFVANRSSGKMGHALARAARLRGARVVLVTGPSVVTAPFGVEVVRVETALEMRDAVMEAVGDVDVAVHAAAVTDFRPSAPRRDKLKRESAGGEVAVRMVANPDIAAESAARMKPGAISVGFALETTDLVERAAGKLAAKGFDLIAANPAGEPDAGFEADTNRVTILDRDGRRSALPLMTKSAAAWKILDAVEERLRGGEGS